MSDDTSMPEIICDFADDNEEILSDVEVDLPEARIKVDQSIFLEANKDLDIDEEGQIQKKPPQPKVKKKKPPTEKQLAALEKTRLKREQQRKDKEELLLLREQRDRLKKEMEDLRNRPPVIKEIKPPDNTELIKKTVEEALEKHKK
jgi:hypothetical protein